MRMRMQIPSIGDRIRLTADWTFTLYAESRNESLGEATGHFTPLKYYGRWSNGRSSVGFRVDDEGIRVGGYDDYERCSAVASITLPAGAILTIDRIYIRKGATEFNSLSFLVVNALAIFKKKGKVRFWAKLPEVNTIEFEKIA